jgi:prostamide/prostaglandin F2alpha synthase
MSLLNKKARDAIAKNKVDKLDSNLQGDGLQTGGTLVVTKGGEKVLLDFRQDNPADHVTNAEILRVLGIPSSGGEGQGEMGASSL